MPKTHYKMNPSSNKTMNQYDSVNDDEEEKNDNVRENMLRKAKERMRNRRLKLLNKRYIDISKKELNIGKTTKCSLSTLKLLAELTVRKQKKTKRVLQMKIKQQDDTIMKNALLIMQLTQENEELS